MKQVARGIHFGLSFIRLLPHLAAMGLSPNRGVIVEDLRRWSTVLRFREDLASAGDVVSAFAHFMTMAPEYRSLFYYRLGAVSAMLRFLCRPMPTLFITTRDIGPGLFIHHGFSTIISAERIGRNCWINQQVTIGYSSSSDCPILCDNVVINAGAKVIGGITVGDNTRVGANAVVVKDVPANCTVVGVPAYIVRRDGKKTNEPLI